ncbi:MAG: hypothetical protein RLZZ361_1027, partial [Cyanobacteriota bacterium]
MPEISPILNNNLSQISAKNTTENNSAIIKNSNVPIIENTPKKQSNFFFKNLQLAGLFITLPIVIPSLLIQADNITKYGEKGESGIVNFTSSVIDILTSPLRYLIHRIFKINQNYDDVSANKRSFIFENFFQRILHPNFVREVSSMLFGVRRSLFNFFPKVFITPSEEQHREKDHIKQASSSLANLFFAGSSLVSPIR